MSILIFFVILAVLILVHEFGHFIVAKKSGIKVKEFGLGFPPRIFGIQKGETLYSLNWIPFGGFVKIFGEDPDEESISGPESQRSFVNKSKWIQAAVLVAGVTFNIIFAWILISAGYMTGLPTPVDGPYASRVKDAHVVVLDVVKGSPAEKAGLMSGDSIVSLRSGNDELDTFSVPQVQDFIASHGNAPLDLIMKRGNDEYTKEIIPETGLVSGKSAIGISMDMIGSLSLPIYLALWEGAKLTGTLIWSVATGLISFVAQIFILKANFSQVTGPVGIVSLVGSASRLGFVYLLSFTAFISLNLAVINLIPFPALDGGRLLFVLIEAIRRKPIKPATANMINTIGFGLLLLLMVVVTLHDIIKLF